MPENDVDDVGGDRSADAAPVHEDVERARAMAEVEVMQDGNADVGRRRDDDNGAAGAVLGAPGVGVEGFEVVDKVGEAVRIRFQTFLQVYYEDVEYEEEVEEGPEAGTVVRRSRQIFPYREQLARLAARGDLDDDEDDVAPSSGLERTLVVDHAHLRSLDRSDEHLGELAEALEQEFVRFEPFLRRAVVSCLRELHPESDFSGPAHVAVVNLPQVLPVRRLRTDRVGRLCAVSGTVTRTSDVRPELLAGSFRCTRCGTPAGLVAQQFHFTRPTVCRNPRCGNTNPSRFLLETEDSEFVDWQKLRVQENAHEIPPGSMPRSIDAVVRGECVERVKAGDVCVLVGSLVVVPDAGALARAGESARTTSNDGAAGGGAGGVRGLRATGVKELTYRTCFLASSVEPADAVARGRGSGAATTMRATPDAERDGGHRTPEEVVMAMTPDEREEIRRMRSSPQLYSQMVNSICPRTFGHLEVKRGILLMLLGGVHKTTPEGIKLRGDINVCIVGDPSTAKSQFLKYVRSFSSRCVYTSGKASSAAGLTASVQRDVDTGEFVVEAGALMLADNGVCCIDEFDKMDVADQVAIHEAMEQQTISVTKAGVQATLNARTSVLAAANPVHGRYDRSRTLRANVALSAPILSRFDLFFVVLDECDELADYNVAKHILDVHRGIDGERNVPFTKGQMQRYVRFARSFTPRLTKESQRVMVDCYRRLRQGDSLGRSRTAYRITVRQLESMIRLSEALAKLHCDDEVNPSYVREAFRLLKKSIIHVETEDVTFDEEEEEEDAENDAPTTTPAAPPPHRIGEYAGPGEEENNVAPTMRTTNEEDEVIPVDKDDDVVTVKKEKRKKKKKKKKTQITFEEYESISNAISTYLRSKEVPPEDEDENDAKDKRIKTTWGDTVEWYLEQCEREIGDSEEELERLRKLTNLVLRRLVNVDRVLIIVGESEGMEESQRELAVHPNYVVS